MKKLIMMIMISYGIIYAQSDSLKVFELQPITITASKYEQSLRTLTLSYTTVSQNELNQSDKSSLLGSLSGKIPGLFISERDFGGFGISNPAGKISIRGITGIQQVLIVVDGRPEFAGIFGHPVADNYYSSQIEAVDVVRGPSSVLYGSNAMSGVINITTKKNHVNGFSYSGNFDLGTYNSRSLNGSAGIKTDKIDANVSVSNDYSDNSRPSASFNSTTGMLNASYYLNPGWSLNFNGYINTTKAYNPGTIDKPFGNNSVWTNATRANTSISVHNKNNKTEGSAIFFFNNGVHDLYDGFHSNDQLFGATIYQGFSLLEKNITTFGAELKNYGGSARNKMPMIDTTVTETAAFVAINQSFSEKLSFNGGVRLTNHSVYGLQLIPQITFQYDLLNTTTLNLSASRGFRSPTLGELFLFGANTNLKPEKLWSYEFGIRQKLLAEQLEINLNGFLIEGTDLIVMTGSFPNNKNQNINTLKNKGAELQARYMLSKNFSMNANYSYTGMETQMIGAPESQAFFECNYTIASMLINFSIKNISNLLTAVSTQAAKEKKQNFTLINGAIWYKLQKQLTIYLKGENLLNKQYEIIDGYPMPGATMRFGISLNGSL